MKVAVSVRAEVSPLSRARAVPAARAETGRLAAYLELTKPRIAVLVLFTVGAGVLFAGGWESSPAVLLHAVVGTALVAAGACALNQWLERDADAHMRRTARRPLPSGRLQPREAFVFGLALSAVGLAYLLALAGAWAALIAGITLLGYVAVYTPLKGRTVWNTLVGAVPGALPPLIGWCAVRGAPTREAWPLFLILFLWQLPHFLAIAWMYRDEYARAGMCMLPVGDATGARTARHMVGFCLALCLASLTPALWCGAGWPYLAGALALGLGFLTATLRFARRRSHARARAVLRASLLYLPAVLALLLLDRLWT
jgi:protoheme IX farnesyltransferase